MSLHIEAYAKLNLWLAVLARREDGYHTIQSLVQTIDLADHIEVKPASHLRVTCDVPMEGPNLVDVALRRLLREKRSARGFSVRITKRIPLGSGLGGGSSDAAAVMAVVNRLVPPRLPISDLSELGAELGADIPLFLTGGRQVLGETGQVIAGHPPSDDVYVLVVPPIHCSTADIYCAWDETRPKQAIEKKASSSERRLGENDLMGPAISLVPELAKISEAVAGLDGEYSGMSGSGSAFFAAFSDHRRARRTAVALGRKMPDCQVYYCHSTRDGFSDEGTLYEDCD